MVEGGGLAGGFSHVIQSWCGAYCLQSECYTDSYQVFGDHAKNVTDLPSTRTDVEAPSFSDGAYDS
jgi:hypothetical protein